MSSAPLGSNVKPFRYFACSILNGTIKRRQAICRNTVYRSTKRFEGGRHASTRHAQAINWCNGCARTPTASCRVHQRPESGHTLARAPWRQTCSSSSCNAVDGSVSPNNEVFPLQWSNFGGPMCLIAFITACTQIAERVQERIAPKRRRMTRTYFSPGQMKMPSPSPFAKAGMSNMVHADNLLSWTEKLLDRQIQSEAKACRAGHLQGLTLTRPSLAAALVAPTPPWVLMYSMISLR